MTTIPIGLGSSETNVTRFSDAILRRVLRTVRYFGRAEEDFPSAVVADEVAIFGDHLEAFLSTNWVEWVAACDNVEAAAGISLAKNQLAYRKATLEAKGTVPEMLMQILAKV